MSLTVSIQRTPKPPRRARGELRVRSLLDAAEAVFSEVGYDDATMSAIALRAGAPIGSLYQFFPGKEAVGIALIDQYLQTLAVAWARLGEGLRRDAIGKLCSGLTHSTRKIIGSMPAYRALESVSMLNGSPSKGRAALLVELQILISKVAPECRANDRITIAAVVLQLIKSEYALDHLVDRPLALQAQEEIRFVIESYLSQRLRR